MARLERWMWIAACIAVALLAGLFTLHRFDDLDLCWHLRTGEWILAEGRIPHHDPFWSGKAPPEWIDFEWGSQVIAALVAHLAGLAGLQLSVAALAMGTLLVFLLRQPRSPTLLLAALCFTVMVWQRFLVRPDILSLPLLLLAMTWLDRLPVQPRVMPWRLALLTAAGVNLHGSFILIPAFIAVSMAGALLSRMDRDTVRAHARALGLCLAAGLLNPYGYKIYVLFTPYVRSLLSAAGFLPPLQSLVEGEWLPTWRLLTTYPLFPVASSLLLLGALVVSFARLGRRRISPRRAACALAALALGLSAFRHLLPFGAIALSVIAQNEKERLDPGGVPAGAEPPRRHTWKPVMAGGVLLIALGLQISLLTDGFYARRNLSNVTGVGFNPETAPEGAVAWLASHRWPGTIFNNSNSGAYLLYRLYPNLRPYCDSRLIDMARYQEILRANQDPAVFDALVRRDGIGTVVLVHPSPETYTLLPRLTHDERWRMAFRDANSTIHVRVDLPPPATRNPPLPLAGTDDRPTQTINRLLARFKRHTIPAAEIIDATLSEQIGDRDRQIAAYRRALERSPDYAPALLGLQRLGVAPE
jgi:hypothetical protein